MQFFVKGLCSNPIWPREGPGLQELPGVGNFFIKPPPSFQIRYFLAQKGMFLCLRKHTIGYVFRDFLCHADIGKHIIIMTKTWLEWRGLCKCCLIIRED